MEKGKLLQGTPEQVKVTIPKENKLELKLLEETARRLVAELDAANAKFSLAVKDLVTTLQPGGTKPVKLDVDNAVAYFEKVEEQHDEELPEPS